MSVHSPLGASVWELANIQLPPVYSLSLSLSLSLSATFFSVVIPAPNVGTV